jgi:hypothetical protein
MGAELRVLRGPEAFWEWNRRVSSPGPTYFRDYINATYDNGIIADDTAETASKTSIENSILPNAAAAHASRKTDFENFFLGTFMAGLLVASDEDRSAGPIQYQYDSVLLATGEVQISQRLGIYALLRQDMIDNAESILENTVTPGAFTPGPANIGTLVLGFGPTFEDHTLSGTLVFRVIDDTVGAVQLSLQNVLDDNDPLVDGTTIIQADNSLTVGKQYQDGPNGVSIRLDLGAPVIAGDAPGPVIFSLLTINTPSELDTNKGIIYIQVERFDGLGGDPDFKMRWYKDANFIPANLIQTRSITGLVGTVVLNIQGLGTSITVTFSMTNAALRLPVVTDTDDDITFSLLSPRVGDRWSIGVVNNYAGNYATKIARRWRASLNSAAVPTIADAGAASVPMT